MKRLVRLKRQMRSASLAAIALSGWPTAVYAQTSDLSEPAASESDQPSDGSAINNRNEIIVVTASKRSERLQNVPSAVTALSSAKIEELGIERISDYTALVPGFSFRDNGAPGYGTVILRGLNTGANQAANTTAFYFDNTPVTANGSLSIGGLVTIDPDVSDVERIEVLKGPQGTLYGANSLGGLVKIVSRQPDLTRFFGSARLDGSVVDGGNAGYGGRLSVNLPLVDGILGLTASGLYRHTPGWADNVGTGRQNSNEGDVKGGRVSVLWQATPNLKLQAAGMYQETKTSGWNFTQALTDSLIPEFGRYKYDFALDQGIHSRYTIAELNADYDVGVGNIIANGSYGKYDIDLFFDYTPAYGPFVPAALGPVALGTFPTIKADKYSGDLRFVSNRLGPVEFILGAFYTKEDSLYNIESRVFSLPSKVRLAPPFDTSTRIAIGGSYEEISGYGNLTFYITDNFDVTGGLRYSHSTQNYSRAPALVFFSPLPEFAYPLIKEDNTAFLGTVRWRISPQVSTYFRVASAYRPSSPNTGSAPGFPAIVAADSVWNYELGLKGGTRDGAFSGDISLYHIDWKKVQITGLFQGLGFLLNGGNAYVNGLEIQTQMRPTYGLTFGANFAYNFSKFTSVDPAASASTGVQVGSRLPLTPEYALALTSDYEADLGSSKLTIGGTLRFTGENHSSYSANAGTNPDLKLPGFTTLDLRAGVNFSRYNLIARVKNVTNTYGIATAATTKAFVGQTGTGTLLTPIQPRTFEISLGVNF